MKNIFKSLIFYFIAAFGISLNLLSNIGVSPFISLNNEFSVLSHIKFGTFMTITNLVFLVIYYFVSEKKDLKEILIMFISVISFGYATNLFLYTILKNVNINYYPYKILLFIVGTIISGFGVGLVLKLETLKFPVEATCQKLSEKTKFTFAHYRYAIDIICIGASLAVSYFYTVPLSIREGTIISFIIFPGTIAFFSSSKTKFKTLKKAV